MPKTKTILAKSMPIALLKHLETDFISLTDMVRASESGSSIIENWLRNKNTLEFLAAWEKIYNHGFKTLEFEEIKKEVGLNCFTMSVKQWISRTNATGLLAQTGRNGGTFAHKDIAFEFANWISPKFKLYLLKVFQRLNDDENSSRALEWNLTRSLSKINYRIHTDAIAENIIPQCILAANAASIYASEADVLNVPRFGLTVKQWPTT